MLAEALPFRQRAEMSDPVHPLAISQSLAEQSVDKDEAFHKKSGSRSILHLLNYTNYKLNLLLSLQ